MATFFEQLLKQAIENLDVPSIAIEAKQRDGTQLLSLYLDSPSPLFSSQDAIDSNTLFTLASLTKLPTSVAALQQVEKGIIGLDNDVTHLLPTLKRQRILQGFKADGVPVLKDRTNPITLRHLLTHSAGTGYDFSNDELRRVQSLKGECLGSKPTVEQRFNLPLLFEPGESWNYGCSIDWVGRLVEILTNMDLETYMSKHIWQPLGVTRFTFRLNQKNAATNEVAVLAERDNETKRLRPLPEGLPLNNGVTDCFGGQGGYSTVPNFMQLLYSLLANDGRILKAETVDLLFQGHLTPASKSVLNRKMEDPSWAVGTFYPGETYNWSLGGLLIEKPGSSCPFSRGLNTLVWSGATNLFWVAHRVFIPTSKTRKC
ncbi:beta-lactamase/transpeptidase-like protein [Fusarium redolens]|uniref:Beta-lactamase/transpeptidase-like protein n=1 Tax=Fusarium redolens TaxID=48865 RepID=A0A9P9HXG7_FUSRE|nr:beta-lactamase/transpeptidase-like protein [Fusarium redolens]KAH7265728.1 beta-lactamase/transpeptidase-like protein [Fusarium redolens]